MGEVGEGRVEEGRIESRRAELRKRSASGTGVLCMWKAASEGLHLESCE